MKPLVIVAVLVFVAMLILMRALCVTSAASDEQAEFMAEQRRREREAFERD